jgi:7-cyano-7-deazaguanine synthase
MQLDHSKALVIFSGGQDSTTCLGWALANFREVFCLTFDYGQRHAAEVEAARQVIEFFREKTGKLIRHEIVRDLGHVLESVSPLTSSEELETYDDHSSMEAIIGDRVEKTFVPMRNTLFLTIAANRAVAMGCGRLVTGVCQADNANYPDCTMPFIVAMEHAINTSLGLVGTLGLAISTPLMFQSKAETVRLAQKMPHTYDALAFSHTAYDGKYPPTGKDHASILRAHGFEQAGVPDPLVVRAWREGLMELPDTDNYVELIGDPARLPPNPHDFI